MSEAQPELLCPSARCEPGAVLLGIVGPDNRVGYVTPRLTVDEDFVAAAQSARTPEKRLRFAQPCIESGCRHWQGRCQVADGAVELDEAKAEASGPLPRCSIRPDCRWFAQLGARACRACPFVVTDVRDELEAARA